VSDTVQNALDRAEPAKLADLVRELKLGSMLSPLNVTVTALGTPAAAIDLTDPATFAAATVNLGSPAYTKTLPPALMVVALRVVSGAGAAATGVREISDSGDTPTTAIATLSDDGKTLTFEDTVGDFVIVYVPRSDVDPVGTDFPNT
jgi:hypothetical protein